MQGKSKLTRTGTREILINLYTVVPKEESGKGELMFDYECDGQINFKDYFQKPKLDIKPKNLVDFINGMGICQYKQIRNVVRETVDQGKYEVSEEAIERITNNVSVWLLKIGMEYKEYLNSLLN